jgi:hypothetical protein
LKEERNDPSLFQITTTTTTAQKKEEYCDRPMHKRVQLKETAITNRKERLKRSCFERIRTQREQIVQQLRDKHRNLTQEERDELDRQYLQMQIERIMRECYEELDEIYGPATMDNESFLEIMCSMQEEMDSMVKEAEDDNLLYWDKQERDLVADEFEKNEQFEKQWILSQISEEETLDDMMDDDS